MARLVQVPPGVQCFVGEEARRRRALEARVVAVFDGWSYEEIVPPLVDYAEVFAGEALQSRTYSFPGRDGSLLALRPDFTSLLAKIAAGRLADREPPLRLWYAGEVVRYETPKAGRQDELFQMGLEHIGGDPAAADVEVLAVAAECLEVLGVRGAVLALGHVGVFHALLAGVDATDVAALRALVESRDAAGLREGAAARRLDGRVREALLALTTATADDLGALSARLGFCPAARAALDELGARIAALTAAGLGEALTVDLAEVRGLDYYTGLVFRVYARGLGFEIGSGGRYDGLLARFGRPLPAVGFMLGLDRLALAFTGPDDERGPAVPVAALRDARAARRSGQRVRLEVS